MRPTGLQPGLTHDLMTARLCQLPGRRDRSRRGQQTAQHPEKHRLRGRSANRAPLPEPHPFRPRRPIKRISQLGRRQPNHETFPRMPRARPRCSTQCTIIRLLLNSIGPQKSEFWACMEGISVREELISRSDTRTRGNLYRPYRSGATGEEPRQATPSTPKQSVRSLSSLQPRVIGLDSPLERTR